MTFSEIKNKLFSDHALMKNSAVLFAGTMLASVLNYVFHLVIGKQVSVEIYGETESLISLITIISVPAMTLSMVAAKYAASCSAEGDRNGSREILNYLNKKVLKYSWPLFLLAVVATPFVGNFLNIKNNFAIILIWIAMLLSFFAAINSGMLSGWQKFKDISVAGVCGAASKLIFGVVLVKFGFALNGIVGSFVLGSLAAYIVTLFALKFIITKKPDNEVTHCNHKIDFKSLKRYIMPVFVGNLAITILGNADMVLAKHNLDALAAGQYAALTVVSKIIFFATGIIASVLFSMSAENSHKGNSSRHILKTALILVLVASSGATLIYFTYPALILSVLFGSKYQDVAPYLGWFAIAVTLFSLYNVIFQYLLSIHKTKISYTFLAVAIFMLVMIALYGKSIGAILMIVIISQIVAIISGIFFLLDKKEKKNV